MSVPAAAGLAAEIIECPICMDDMDVPRTLVCGHSIHNGCAVKSMNATILNTGVPSCPFCRGDQSSDDGIKKIQELIGQITDDNAIAAKYLISLSEVQANINLLAPPMKISPLYAAVHYQRLETIQDLLDAGASVTLQVSTPHNGNITQKELSPLNLTCSQSQEVFDAVIARCTADEINQQHDKCPSVLHRILDTALNTQLDLEQTFTTLRAKGADFNLLSSRTGLTPLQHTVQMKFAVLMEFFLEQDFQIDPHLLNNNGESAMKMAVLANRVDMVWTLLDYQVQLSVGNPENQSMLQMAENQGLDKIAEAIKQEYKSFFNLKDTIAAVNSPHLPGNVNTIVAALERHYSAEEAQYVDISAQIIPKSYPAYPPLFLAIMSNQENHIVKLVTKFHANPETPFLLQEGLYLTPYEFAQALGRGHLLEDFYARDFEKYTQPNRNGRYAEAPF